MRAVRIATPLLCYSSVHKQKTEQLPLLGL